MKTDIEIAHEIKLKNIDEVLKIACIDRNDAEMLGNHMAKITPKDKTKKGKLILVTAINPSKAGEGKTTVSIGLADALRQLGTKTFLTLREPSLGPVFGIKGGATGGGYSQVVPMEDINLHFTGDFHAITTANNLISAVIDNHIFQGNTLNIKTVTFQRCLDMNDRALRNVIVSADKNGRTENFVITAASEIMAIFCLAKDFKDLKNRLNNVIIGYNNEEKPITVKDLDIGESVAALLFRAVKPNLVQTIGGTPTLIHGGPFANIAHGCNSIIATKTALSLADYVVTEAGFGADLGAEKFVNIKCRASNLSPSCIVLVATVRALKLNGGAEDLKNKNIEALKKGIVNLEKHIENIKSVFCSPCVVAINKFDTDTNAELEIIKSICALHGVKAFACTVWSEGGKGGLELAKEVKNIVDKNKLKVKFTYDLNLSIEEKIKEVATKIYGADDVEYSEKAKKEISKLQNSSFKDLPICIAKTQYSLSDNQNLLGEPKNFKIFVRDAQLRSGAGFIVIVAGDIMLMPGLPKTPNATKIKITDDGIISGLF